MSKLNLIYIKNDITIDIDESSYGLHSELSKYFKTCEVSYSHGSVNLGYANMPAVFVITDIKNNKQFDCKVYEF